ncbi:replication initiation protein [Pseudonocardia sp. Ae707_Ps2]|uniref:replication initiation protein n=1 Tax=Pseudonocardia sp. Ae707_Ps2 TaxID=2212992 RepID=UPI003FD2FE65
MSDHPDAVLRMVSTVDNHPPPNVIIENPVNGHAHAAWAITTPIKITNYGSRRSVRYGLSIEEALRRAVGGDPHYPARLIKNPVPPPLDDPFHPRRHLHPRPIRRNPDPGRAHARTWLAQPTPPHPRRALPQRNPVPRCPALRLPGNAPPLGRP